MANKQSSDRPKLGLININFLDSHMILGFSI
jgi:hypothetical protein